MGYRRRARRIGEQAADLARDMAHEGAAVALQGVATVIEGAVCIAAVPVAFAGMVYARLTWPGGLIDRARKRGS